VTWRYSRELKIASDRKWQKVERGLDDGKYREVEKEIEDSLINLKPDPQDRASLMRRMFIDELRRERNFW
jgi:hypothetical protein